MHISQIIPANRQRRQKRRARRRRRVAARLSPLSTSSPSSSWWPPWWPSLTSAFIVKTLIQTYITTDLLSTTVSLTLSVAWCRTPTRSLARWVTQLDDLCLHRHLDNRWSAHWSCTNWPATVCLKASGSACADSPTGDFWERIIISFDLCTL